MAGLDLIERGLGCSDQLILVEEVDIQLLRPPIVVWRVVGVGDAHRLDVNRLAETNLQPAVLVLGSQPLRAQVAVHHAHGRIGGVKDIRSDDLDIGAQRHLNDLQCGNAYRERHDDADAPARDHFGLPHELAKSGMCRAREVARGVGQRQVIAVNAGIDLLASFQSAARVTQRLNVRLHPQQRPGERWLWWRQARDGDRVLQGCDRAGEDMQRLGLMGRRPQNVGSVQAVAGQRHRGREAGAVGVVKPSPNAMTGKGVLEEAPRIAQEIGEHRLAPAYKVRARAVEQSRVNRAAPPFW